MALDQVFLKYGNQPRHLLTAQKKLIIFVGIISSLLITCSAHLQRLSRRERNDGSQEELLSPLVSSSVDESRSRPSPRE